MGFTGFPVGAVGSTPQLGGPGLAHIRSVTFSAAATVSVDGCFNQLFDNYRLVVSVASSAGAQNLLLRFRVAGVDNSTAVYGNANLEADSTSVTGSRLTNQNNTRLCYMRDTDTCQVSADILSPALASNTGALAISLESVGAMSAQIQTLSHVSSTSFDGFTIYPATSGTITGTLSIYGYRKG